MNRVVFTEYKMFNRSENRDFSFNVKYPKVLGSKCSKQTLKFETSVNALKMGMGTSFHKINTHNSSEN